MARSEPSALGARRAVLRAARAALARLPAAQLKKVPGVALAYGAVYRLLAPRGETVVECEGHRLHVHAGDQGVARQILMTGIYEPEETRFFSEWVRPGMAVLDVGANFGYFTVLAARRVGPSGVVHSFEPEPGNFALLEKNIAVNGYLGRAHPHRLALSDAPGRAELFTDSTNLGNPSFAKSNVPHGKGSVFVDVDTLDAFLERVGPARPRIDLVKMDTQGFEARVLAGARRLLEHDRPWLLVEIWPDGVRRAGDDPAALLEGLARDGYVIRRLDKSGSPGAELDASALLASCARRETGEDFQNVLFEPR